LLWHRIAYDWRCTVEELQERIPSSKFTELAAYLRIEPRGYEMDNWRFGMLAATVNNVQSNKKLKPKDFYPPGRKKQPQLSPRQQQQLKAKREREKAKKSLEK
jgi:hypothetical protein